MNNLRTYGQGPFRVAVVHGGPGAAGEMRPVARELSSTISVLEPLQTATSVKGQIDELAEIVKSHAEGPATLIGHSWGAWLAYLLAAEHPELVKNQSPDQSAGGRSPDQGSDCIIQYYRAFQGRFPAYLP